jgi:hypothetical protein
MTNTSFSWQKTSVCAARTLLLRTALVGAVIEADNGAQYAIVLNLTRHFTTLVQSGVWDVARDGWSTVYFDWRLHTMGQPGAMSHFPLGQ